MNSVIETGRWNFKAYKEVMGISHVPSISGCDMRLLDGLSPVTAATGPGQHSATRTRAATTLTELRSKLRPSRWAKRYGEAASRCPLGHFDFGLVAPSVTTGNMDLSGDDHTWFYQLLEVKDTSGPTVACKLDVTIHDRAESGKVIMVADLYSRGDALLGTPAFSGPRWPDGDLVVSNHVRQVLFQRCGDVSAGHSISTRYLFDTRLGTLRAWNSMDAALTAFVLDEDGKTASAPTVDALLDYSHAR